MRSWLCLGGLSRSVMMMGIAVAIAAGQTGPAAAQPARPFTVRVTPRAGATDVALKAENALLSEIAVDLAKRLRANVTVGPTLREERVSVEIGDTALEPALASLAARVLVDYELRQDAQPIPQDIYLLGINDPDPKLNTTERGVSVGLMFSGNTEDVAPAPADDPLLITGNRQALSVTVKKQPLSMVAMALGEVLGLPVESRYDAAELIDFDVRSASAEEIVPRISPHLRLIVRVDASTSERTLVRLVVARSAER